MRALICRSYEGWQALEVGEMPDPEPMPGTAVVRVEAAAVNFADLLIVAGQYQVKPELPFVPGNEFAGIVEASDDVRGWVRAMQPSAETTQIDGRPAAVRINLLMETSQD